MNLLTEARKREYIFNADSVQTTLIDLILGYDSSNLIAYWPLTETIGSDADNVEGSSSLDGTYSNVALNQDTFSELPVGLWDSVSNSYVSLPHAALASVMNESLFTIQIWTKVTNASVWTNGSLEEWLYLAVNGNNRIRFTKISLSNRVDVIYSAGGVTKTVVVTPVSSLDYMHWCITVDKANDRMRVYLNGSQQGAEQTGLGVWSGSFINCFIGALATTTFNANAYIGHVTIWNREFSASEVSDLANLPN